MPLGEYLSYDVNTARVRVDRNSSVDEFGVSSVFDYLEDRLRERAVPADPALPFDFHLGYVGYLGYELKAETRRAAMPTGRRIPTRPWSSPTGRS